MSHRETRVIHGEEVSVLVCDTYVPKKRHTFPLQFDPDIDFADEYSSPSKAMAIEDEKRMRAWSDEIATEAMGGRPFRRATTRRGAPRKADYE